MEKVLVNGGGYLLEDCPAETVYVPEDFDDEQKALAATIEQFVANEVLPNVERLESHDFERMVRILKKSGELGLLMIEGPEKYGGLELGKTTSILASEKMSPYGGFMVAYMVLTGIGLLPLVYYGSERQKEKYLGKLISGEWMSAYCLTEPDSGSDALGAKTTATLSADGTHYILNGTKQFISNGSFADLYTVFAKVDRKHFTAFLVERSFPGVAPGPEEKKLGIKGSSTTQLILEDARVPVENVLGEIGKGHKIAFNVLNVGRFKLGGSSAGAAKAAFGEGVRYANLRRQFGVPIASFGAIREKIAGMAASIFASESLVYRLAGMIDDRVATIPKGIPDYYDAYQRGIEEYAAECAIAKVFCTEVLAQVADEVLQIHGGYGFVQEYPAERIYRDERVNRIYEGTNEINRILLAGTLLKRLSKDGPAFARRVKESLEVMENPAVGGSDGPTSEGSAERAVLAKMKHVFLALAGTAAERFGDRVKDEQEFLMALSDVAIQIFAVESAVARAEKILPALPPAGKESVRAAVKIFTFQAVESVATSARKAAFSIGEERLPDRMVRGIRKLAEYDAPGLVASQRILAAAALDAEKYVF